MAQAWTEANTCILTKRKPLEMEEGVNNKTSGVNIHDGVLK
jgi:hypothetical protein